MGTDGNGRWVLVTGASSGIGRACALHLDSLGFRVLGTVRREADAAQLCESSSDRIIPLMLDVTDEASIAAVAQQVGRVVGPAGLYGLLNNAGVGFIVPLEAVSLADLRAVFEVNVFGAVAVTSALLPLLRLARGRLVSVSSIASLFAVPFHGPYSATKTALNTLSDTLRLELRPHGVHVSIVICGSVATRIWTSASEWSARLADDYPPEIRDAYFEDFRRVRAYAMRSARAGIPPEQAARVISRAFTDSRPRIRYHVGPDARLFAVADRLLGRRLRDRVLLRSIARTRLES